MLVTHLKYPLVEDNKEHWESRLSAKFIGISCVPTSPNLGGWMNQPAGIFYTSDPDRSKGHFCFVAITEGYSPNSALMVGLGDSYNSNVRGLYLPDYDEFVYSTHRHGFTENSTGAVFVDGGRDYFRRGFKKSIEAVDSSYNLLLKEIMELK